jgi:hypothetical protein
VGPLLHFMEGLQWPHNRILWERLQQKHTLGRHDYSQADCMTEHSNAAMRGAVIGAVFGAAIGVLLLLVGFAIPNEHGIEIAAVPVFFLSLPTSFALAWLSDGGLVQLILLFGVGPILNSAALGAVLSMFRELRRRR